MNTYPPWLKKRLVLSPNVSYVKDLLRGTGVKTVCEESLCPNVTECYSKKFLTFLILGKACSRACGFCSVEKGAPEPVDPEEIEGMLRIIERLGLRYVIITSVTRDDLEDGGSGHFADVVRVVKRCFAGIVIEVLTPDFNADAGSIAKVMDASPDVFGHNIETVRRLYPQARTGADYDRSLEVLRLARRAGRSLIKSGMMLGLGETIREVIETMRDLKAAGCDALTIGQYLRPTSAHMDVKRYVAPSEFGEYARLGEDMGFAHVAAGPFVRSSYMAEEGYKNRDRH